MGLQNRPVAGSIDAPRESPLFSKIEAIAAKTCGFRLGNLKAGPRKMHAARRRSPRRRITGAFDAAADLRARETGLYRTTQFVPAQHQLPRLDRIRQRYAAAQLHGGGYFGRRRADRG